MKRLSQETKIGAVFVISLVFLYIGLNFLKGSNVFSHYHTYYMVVSHASGVAPSAVISTNGYQVGTVSSVKYDYTHPNRIVVALRIDESLRIPKGSCAYLVNELLGGVSVDLQLGQSSVYYADGDTIESGTAHSLTSEIEQVMLPQIKAMIPRIESLINSMNTLVSDPHIVHILEQTEQLTTKLNTTTLAMNRLLLQEMPQLMHSLQSTGNNLNEITTELKGIDYIETMELVNGTLENLLTLSETLNTDSGTVGRLLNDTAFYNRLDGVCTHAEQLLKDIKEHPSRYINVSVFGKK